MYKFVNHSGGAYGSDAYWGLIGNSYNVKSMHYYYKNKTPYGNHEITEQEYIEGLQYAQDAAKALNRTWSRKPFVHYLLSRNWQQVKHADSIYAVGTIEKKSVIRRNCLCC